MSEGAKAIVGAGSLDDMPLGLACGGGTLAVVALSGAVHLFTVQTGPQAAVTLSVSAVLRGPQAAVTTLCVDTGAGVVYYAGAAGTVCAAPLSSTGGVGGGGAVRSTKLSS